MEIRPRHCIFKCLGVSDILVSHTLPCACICFLLCIHDIVQGACSVQATHFSWKLAHEINGVIKLWIDLQNYIVANSSKKQQQLAILNKEVRVALQQSLNTQKNPS